MDVPLNHMLLNLWLGIRHGVLSNTPGFGSAYQFYNRFCKLDLEFD